MSESNELLLKGVKKVSIIKTENFMGKEDFKKIARMSLEIDGIKREYIDSLLVRCLKR